VSNATPAAVRAVAHRRTWRHFADNGRRELTRRRSNTKIAFDAAVAVAISVAPITMAAPVAHADPPCVGFTNEYFVQACQRLEATCQESLKIPDGGANYRFCEQGRQRAEQQERDEQEQQRQRQQRTSQVNAPTTQAPTSKPATAVPPKSLGASQQAIEAAKAAPATPVDPANPPAPPNHVDFSQQVQSVVKAHSANLDVVNGLAHPRHWDYIDYDVYHRPVLFNPLNDAMTFRYFYSGSYREVYVAASSRVVLNVAVGGVFPFTAVGQDYVTSGSFSGGAWIPPDGWNGPPPADYTPPTPAPLYQDVAAYVPAYNQTVQVGKVQPVGHDDSQPAGSQDTFMLDDSTLAWGQANNPANGGQITVTKTQTLPGVGPTDNGKSLIDLAVTSHPQGRSMIGLLIILAGFGLVIAGVAIGVVIWVSRRGRTA
jgi:hypothetical protein